MNIQWTEGISNWVYSKLHYMIPNRWITVQNHLKWKLEILSLNLKQTKEEENGNGKATKEFHGNTNKDQFKDKRQG